MEYAYKIGALFNSLLIIFIVMPLRFPSSNHFAIKRTRQKKNAVMADVNSWKVRILFINMLKLCLMAGY